MKVVMIVNQECFDKVIVLFDVVNVQDFNQDECQFKELFYVWCMIDMIGCFVLEVSEVVQFVVCVQYIQCWIVLCSSYLFGKFGYFVWCIGFYWFYVEMVGVLMLQVGYDEVIIEQVKVVVGKQGIKINFDMQMFEDVISFVFIEYYMFGFVGQYVEYSEEKWFDIVCKMWKKMFGLVYIFVMIGGIKFLELLVLLILKVVFEV